MAAARGSFGRSLVGGLALATAELVLPLPGPARAAELRFEVPVDCEIGVHCTVQNYIDHDPGPGAKDQTCGPLTYDGHDGIDIRVPTRRDMEESVPVVAAAAGVVKALRDGMEDISIRDPGADSVRGREAGNSVIVDHGDGWETQYSHMRRGSVAVEVGDRVDAGDRLGLIGLSGNTEFPHLHFS
ncbi:MAG: M23 family metallopeptidase, partial [Kiloniellales bacterium]